MNDYQDISKHQFEGAYNKHLPSKWVKFAFKYFSKKTINENLAVRNKIEFYLIGFFLIGLLSTILNVSKTLIGIVTIIYSIVLVGLVLYLFSAVILNRIRINKIRKILGITKSEYEYLVDKFDK